MNEATNETRTSAPCAVQCQAGGPDQGAAQWWSRRRRLVATWTALGAGLIPLGELVS